MGVTIRDIAQISGVGISTVSRVINNSGPVNDGTRKKVLEAVRDTNYIPNNSARSLKKSDSKTVALLIKGITNPFFHKLIKVIEREVMVRGYTLIIQDVNAVANEMDSAIGLAQDRNLSGVILAGGKFSYSEDKFRQLEIPCVLLTVSAGEFVDKSLYSSVIINDEKAGFEATKQLIELGHKKIGFVFHCMRDSLSDDPNELRFNGYIKALKEYNMPIDSTLYDYGLPVGETGYAVGYNMMQRLYANHRDVTAVFAFSDELAIGVAKAAVNLGLKIPEQLSIIGFDGTEITEYFNPSIDTLYQPADQMALSSIEALFNMIRGGASSHSTFDAVLLKRGSCRAL